MAPTVPYYRFREVLSVRDTDASRFRTLADLPGRRIGTLGGTIAHEILLRAERDFGIKVTMSGSSQPETLHCANRSTKFYAPQCATAP
jgi:ABC-type amino acid transport substrate-binding protein